MKKIKHQARQGDVLLHPITTPIAGRKLRQLPANAKRVDSKDALVLAYGEVTGHCHQITEIDKVALHETPKGRRFLVVNGECFEVDAPALTHEEHGPVRVETGPPRDVLIQEEYRYGSSRQVKD